MIVVERLNKSFKTRSQTDRNGSGRQGLRLASFFGKSADSAAMLHVLKDVSFTAQPGQIYGLLGPNGAGKTTTLRCIATLLKGDSGKILVNGLDVERDSRAVRARIGFLTSDMKMAGNLTPRELLFFFGRLNHLDEDTIALRIGELNNYLDMRDCLNTQVEKCSTGQKQKTAISVSLIHDPDVIIFDEPTNGLDILAAKTVVDFLMDYRARGKTIILSTHIMNEAETLCDCIGIMLQGTIVAEGCLSKLMDSWQQPDLEGVVFSIARNMGIIKGGGSNV